MTRGTIPNPRRQRRRSGIDVPLNQLRIRHPKQARADTIKPHGRSQNRRCRPCNSAHAHVSVKNVWGKNWAGKTMQVRPYTSAQSRPPKTKLIQKQKQRMTKHRHERRPKSNPNRTQYHHTPKDCVLGEGDFLTGDVSLCCFVFHNIYLGSSLPNPASRIFPQHSAIQTPYSHFLAHFPLLTIIFCILFLISIFSQTLLNLLTTFRS